MPSSFCGVPLHHVVEGSGPPLLLVHGIGMSWTAWADVLPLLRDRFACVAVDLPGFGDSPPRAGPASVPALADACAALMRSELGFERFAVAGNSLGGAVALHLALRGAVSSACALSPVGFAEGWERAYLQLSIAAVAAGGGALARVVPRLPAPARRVAVLQYARHGDRLAPERLRATFEDVASAPGLRSAARHGLNWRCPARPDRLPCPVTVAWGDGDLLLLSGPQSARARERLPGASHVALCDCGHLPAWDDPAAVAATIVGVTGPA